MKVIYRNQYIKAKRKRRRRKIRSKERDKGGF